MKQPLAPLLLGALFLFSCKILPTKCAEDQEEFVCKDLSTIVYCEPGDNFEVTVNCAAQDDALVCNTTEKACSLCGNGTLDDGELCDDGNQRDDDFCINNCQTPVVEPCDDDDNNKNGLVDEDCDDDDDDFCDSNVSVAAGGSSACPLSTPGGPGDDCDDTDPDIHPGVREDCDGVDQNCSGDDDPDDTQASVTCGALACLTVGGVTDCGCNSDAQCEANGGGMAETCQESDATCFCKGNDPNRHGVRGQGCDGDDPVFGCAQDVDCPGGLSCTGGGGSNKFCEQAP